MLWEHVEPERYRHGRPFYQYCMRVRDIKKKLESNVKELELIVAKSKSITDLMRHFDFPKNGKQTKYFWELIERHNIDTNHFYDSKVLTSCGQCRKTIKVRQKIINNSRCKKAFCGSSCSAKYNNHHKTKGTRRSKLEAWLEKELNKKYPSLVIHYNRKDAIKAELDVYIHSLKLAFELNGIFHYQPIFGEDKLKNIQKNDVEKLQTCVDNQIQLCIIDVSSQKLFKESNSAKYLNMMTEIIDNRILMAT